MSDTKVEWESTDDYKYGFAQSPDPRVLFVIERDDYAQISELYDGDAINPVIYVEHRYGLRFNWVAGYDGGEAALMQRAYEQWGWDSTARRWLWIFHGIAAENAWGGQDRDGNWIVATSTAFREHIEAEPHATYEEARQDCEELAKDVSKALDGEVYGIGWAVNEARRLPDDEPINLDEWEVSIECWGFVGEEYAQSEAATFAVGGPDLPEMLEVTA